MKQKKFLKSKGDFIIDQIEETIGEIFHQSFYS